MSITRIVYDQDDDSAGGPGEKEAEEAKKFYEFLKSQEKEYTELQMSRMKLIGDQRNLMYAQEEQHISALETMQKELKGAITEQGLQLDEKNEKLLLSIGFSKEELDNLEYNADLQKRIAEGIKKRKKNLEEVRDINKEADELMGSLANKIGLGNSKLTASVAKVGEFALALGSAGGRQAAMLSMWETFKPSQIIGSLIENLISLAMEVDKLGSELTKATGASKSLQQEFGRVSISALNASMTLEQFSSGVKSVKNNLIGFASVSDEVAVSMGKQVAEFEKLGVESSLVTDIMNDMNKSMGATASESLDMTKELIGAGAQLGIGPKEMAEGFRKASGSLAVHGKKSIGIFKNLASAAREAGTSVDTLVSIALKFDTFSDAADAAGKLNSILGTTMSATQMLMMNEDERVETLIRTVNSTGRAFGEMNRFEQKAIAAAAGINDMSEANRIFGMSLGEYKNHQEQMKKSEENQKAFQEAMNNAIPLMTQLTIAFQSMATEGDFVNDVVEAFKFGLEAVQFIAKAVQSPMTLFGLGVAFIAGKAFIAAGSTALFSKALASIGVTAPAAAGGITIFGEGATVGAPGLLAFGAAAIAVGIGVGAAALGISYLVASFQNMNFAEILAGAFAIKIFAASLGALAVVLAGLANPISLAAIAALAVVGGVAYAFSLLVNSVGDAYEKIMGSTDGLINAGASMINIAKTIKQVGTALDNINDKELFKATLENIAIITTGTAASLNSAAAGISQSITSVNNNLKNNIKLTIELDGKSLTGKITDVISDYNGDNTVTVT